MHNQPTNHSHAATRRAVSVEPTEDAEISDTQQNIDWDEATIVDVRNTSMGKPELVKDLGPHRTAPKPPNTKPDRPGLFACQICNRRFLKHVELTNHIEALHQYDPSKPPSMPDIEETPISDEPHPPVPMSDDVPDEGDATIRARPLVEGEQTIRPVTAANLRALESSATSDLADHMEELSMYSSRSRSYSITASSMRLDMPYSVLDPASEPAESDVADEEEPMVWLPVYMLVFLWMKFCYDFSERHSARARQHGAQAGGRHRVPSISGASVSGASTTSSHKSNKRRRSNEGEEEDVPQRHNKKSGRRPGQLTPVNRPLACPFNKYDPFLFGGDASNSHYHNCAVWNDVKTAYLKQHLLRSHSSPEFSCHRCAKGFSTEAAFRDHQREDPPCQLQVIDNFKILPEIQRELNLKSRNEVGLSREEYWFKVYDAVFGPEAKNKRPVEPYYNGPSEEILNSFIRFSERRISEALRRSHQHLGVDAQEYDQENGTRKILQEASQCFMTHLRNNQPGSLAEIKQQNSSTASTASLDREVTTVKQETQHPVPQLGMHSTNHPQNWPMSSPAVPQPTGFVQPHVLLQGINQDSRSTLPQTPMTQPASTHQLQFDNQTFEYQAGYHHNMAEQHALPGSIYHQGPPHNFMVDPGFASFTSDDWDNLRAWAPAEFDNTVEDADLYGAGDLTNEDLARIFPEQDASHREPGAP